LNQTHFGAKKLPMGHFFDNPLMIALRSFVFHVCSGIVSLLFVFLLPLAWGPIWVVWPIFVAFVRIHLWLLRVVCGQHYIVEGELPNGSTPVIIAARHEALWETMVLPVLLKNPVVMLKQEILRYPFAGPVARRLGYIGLDRSGDANRARHAFAEAKAEAKKGRSFLIFPSGTRNPKHRLRVEKGVGVLYRVLKVPCVPIVTNSGTFWPYKSWVRRPGVVKLTVLPEIPAGLQTSQVLSQLEAALGRPV